MMSKSDIDHALHQIEQMVRIARRSTEEEESLDYALGDILDKVTALKDNWDYTEQPAAAPNHEADGQRADAKGAIDWQHLYSQLDDPLFRAVSMAQIVDDLVSEVEQSDRDSWDRFAFAVGHARELMEELSKHWNDGPNKAKAEAAAGGAV